MKWSAPRGARSFQTRSLVFSTVVAQIWRSPRCRRRCLHLGFRKSDTTPASSKGVYVYYIYIRTYYSILKRKSSHTHMTTNSNHHKNKHWDMFSFLPSLTQPCSILTYGIQMDPYMVYVTFLPIAWNTLEESQNVLPYSWDYYIIIAAS